MLVRVNNQEIEDSPRSYHQFILFFHGNLSELEIGQTGYLSDRESLE